MIQFFKTLYLSKRVFYILFSIATLFLLSYWVNILFPLVCLALLALTLVLVFEIVILFKQKGITANRILSEKFSNSDYNAIPVRIKNNYSFAISVDIIDEIPIQFQKRDFLKSSLIKGKKVFDFEYSLRPVKRGEYIFGALHVFASSKLKLVKRRYSFNQEAMVKVYPSFIQMKKYDFLAIDNKLSQIGLKKIRRIGHTMEFEQIKEYVLGFGSFMILGTS